MKFCENCGKEIKENQDYCLNCGVKLKKQNENIKQTLPKWSVIVIVISCFLVGVGTLFSSDNKELNSNAQDKSNLTETSNSTEENKDIEENSNSDEPMGTLENDNNFEEDVSNTTVNDNKTTNTTSNNNYKNNNSSTNLPLKAICNDGSISYQDDASKSDYRGMCSGHQGIKKRLGRVE